MDISAMDPKDIPGLFDAEVVGPDGEKVGTIQQIFATRSPELRPL